MPERRFNRVARPTVDPPGVKLVQVKLPIAPAPLFHQTLLVVVVAVGLCSFSAVAQNTERFSHSIAAHPVPHLPSFVTVVPKEPGEFRSVRMLLVRDGELSSIPLVLEDSTQAFRGSFPTPIGLGSYRFQTVTAAGKLELSGEYVLPPVCQQRSIEALSPGTSSSGTRPPASLVADAISLQEKLEQVRYLKAVIDRVEERQ